MRKLSSVLVALGLGVAASLAVAAPAQAAPREMHTEDGKPGGRVRFTPNGDVVQICDIEADGWAAVVQVSDEDQYFNTYTIRAGGSGTCKTVNAAKGGVYDMVEGHNYKFHIWLQNADSYAYDDWSTWRNVN
jgi:hypothetical protein